MAVKEIEVKYNDPPNPGKKMGKIKDQDGVVYFGFPSTLSQFPVGMKCQLEYSEDPGKDGAGPFRKIVKVIGNGLAPSMPKTNYRQRSNPAEAKQIAVLAIVKEWVPKIPVGDTAALVSAIKSAMDAYDRTLSGTVVQRADDMDDEIPY